MAAESTTEAAQKKSHGQQTAVRKKDSTLNEDREQNRYFENETVMTSMEAGLICCKVASQIVSFSMHSSDSTLLRF